MLSPLVLAIAIDAITEHAREGLINEILFADNLALMSKSGENLREKFLKCEEVFYSMEIKVDLEKTKVMM